MTVYLHGIRADDLPTELSGKFNADCRFANTGGPQMMMTFGFSDTEFIK